MIRGQKGASFKRSELVAHLDACDGKTLGELDVSGVFRKVAGKPRETGVAGDVVEQSILDIRRNSKQEPDIVVDGVCYEVKTTGLRESPRTKTLEAKEPMTITAVSPEKIVREKYFQSHFWRKVSHLLIFYYHYASKETVPPSGYAEFVLEAHEFHEYGDFTSEEQDTLKSDWERVRNFIIHLNGTHDNPQSQYHRISHDLRQELMLLDTAPKWPHNPRFRFKRTFVTEIWRRRCDGTHRLEALPERYTCCRDIDDKCAEIIAKFKGRSINEICAETGIAAKPSKSIAEQLAVRLFGGTRKKMSEIDLFAKIGMTAKSIVLTRSGRRTEDCKFFTIDFDELAMPDISFENSQFYRYFTERKFLFIVFEEPSASAPLGENTLEGFVPVVFGEDFIETELRRTWERIRSLVRNGELREEAVLGGNGKPKLNKNGEPSTRLNLPKSGDGIVFVRGTGADSKDKPVCVNGIRMYRQQVWVKGSYLAEMTWTRRNSR